MSDDIRLSPEDEQRLEALADRLSQKMLERFYSQVGRTVITRVFTWIGVLVLAYYTGKHDLLAFLKGH